MIICTPSINNFGQAKEGDIVQIKFNVTNDYTNPVTVLARAGCQCSTPILPKNTIEPNETIEMVVNFDTLGKVGKNEKEIYLDYVIKGNFFRTTCKIQGTVNP